ncbi:MAG: HNH endonuclease signature motif containing protein [Vulcanimicrobiaceae bacterium]
MKGNERPNPQVKSFLRWAVIRYLGFEACSRCGWAERHPTTGRIPVEVEHIDGDWRNNRPANLTLLCPSCHALTPTYRALNWGRGRQTRLGGRSNPLRQIPALKEGPTERPKKKRAAREQVQQLVFRLADVA